MEKVILHIDLNAFFVRCEEIKNPTLVDKATIIGHQGRGGIVSTCSYKARSFGVRSGMPTYKATILCPEAILLPGDYKFYEKKSNEFFEFVKKIFPIIEIASIDECFVDATRKANEVLDFPSYLKRFQKALFEKTQLKCSIGVGPTKFLAKMGSDIKKPMGLTFIPKEKIKDIIYPLPIDDFFVIGKKTAPELKNEGINTIGDLAKLIFSDDPKMIKRFGKMYFYVKDCLDGESSDVVNVEPYDPKSIGNSKTLVCDSNNYDELKNELLNIADETINRLKSSNKLTNTIQITLKDSDFKSITRSKNLSKFTDNSTIIKNGVVSLFDRNFDETKMIRLVGVSLQNLIDFNDNLEQMSIFNNNKSNKTHSLIDELNKKMNKNVFMTAREGVNSKKCKSKKQ